MPPQRIPRHRTSHGTTRPTESLPSRGGTRGYSQDTRRIAIQNEVNGLNQSVEVNQLRFNGLYPSDRTVRRWNARVVTEGTCRIRLPGQAFRSSINSCMMETGA